MVIFDAHTTTEEEDALSLILEEMAEENLRLSTQLGGVSNRCAEFAKLSGDQAADFMENQKILQSETKHLQDLLCHLHETVTCLSDRIVSLRRLQDRLSSAAVLVECIAALEVTCADAKSSIASGDFEAAAQCIARFRELRKSVRPEETPAVAELEKLEASLLATVRSKFDNAIVKNDKDAVAECTRLFLPLDLQKEGIARYIVFVRGQLAETADAVVQSLRDPKKELSFDSQTSGISFVAAMQKICVSIADDIQDHKESVESQFGTENFALFLRGLQSEAVLQTRRILEEFEKARGRCLRSAQDSSIDMRRLDEALEESSLISNKCHKFDTYIQSRIRASLDSIIETSGALPPGFDAEFAEEPQSRKRQELLLLYVGGEHAFMARQIKSALTDADEVQLDAGAAPVSTLVDDCFFILKKSLDRALRTGDIQTACAVTNHACAILSTRVRDCLAKNLQLSKKAYQHYIQDSAHLTNFSFTALVAEAAEGRKKQPNSARSSHSWPHSVSNLRACIDCIDFLRNRCSEAFAQLTGKRQTEGDPLFVQHALQGFETAKMELQALAETTARETLAILQHHLTAGFVAFENWSYSTDIVDSPSDDGGMKSVISALDAITSHLMSCYSSEVSSAAIKLLVQDVARAIENAALTKRFVLMGAVRFDADVRRLLSFFSRVSDQSVRKMFRRLTEMGDLLNLTTLTELHDIWGRSTATDWRLSSSDVKRVLLLRVDFAALDVQQAVATATV